MRLVLDAKSTVEDSISFDCGQFGCIKLVSLCRCDTVVSVAVLVDSKNGLSHVLGRIENKRLTTRHNVVFHQNGNDIESSRILNLFLCRVHAHVSEKVFRSLIAVLHAMP